MIEPLMYFGLGFLVASLLGLVFLPLVHGRAVRLTERRIQASSPMTLAEFQADKDRLRAEHAVAIRRLELTVEQLRERAASSAAELGRSGSALTRTQLDLGEKTATIAALEARQQALLQELEQANKEFAARSALAEEQARHASVADAKIADVVQELDARRFEIDGLKVEIAAVRGEAQLREQRLSEREQAIDRLQSDLARATDEREKLEEALAAERGRAAELDARLQAIAEGGAEHLSASALSHSERMSGVGEALVATGPRPSVVSGPAEASDQDLLREHIRDIAAEVIRLTALNEGSRSPLHAILREPAERVSPPPPDRAGHQSRSLAERVRDADLRARD